jgi:hypothetical protein
MVASDITMMISSSGLILSSTSYFIEKSSELQKNTDLPIDITFHGLSRLKA